MMIMVLLLGTLFAATLQTSRMAVKVENEAQSAIQVRTGMAALISDIRIGSRILSRYPATGDPVATSNTNRSIVVQVPRFETDGTMSLTDYDVVAYVWTPSDDGSGPVVRSTARVRNGAEGDMVTDRTVLRSISDFQIAYQATESFMGNDSQTSWGLSGRPVGTTNQKIYMGSKDWNGTAMARFADSSVEFERPPRWGIPIDVVYDVDPGTSTLPNGASAATMVRLEIGTKAVHRTTSYKDRSHSVKLQMSAELKNR